MPDPIIVILAINVATVLHYWEDKRRALAGEWRVPESTLLGLAAIGGSPGALLVCRLFRHKIRKQPFATLLRLTAAAQALAAVVWLLAPSLA